MAATRAIAGRRIEGEPSMSYLSRDQVLGLIEAFIQAQYAGNAGVTLSEMARRDCDPYRLHPDLLDFARDERCQIAEILRAEMSAAHSNGDGIISLFVTSTKEFIYQNNQFITLSPEDQGALARLYLEFVADLADALDQPAQVGGIEQWFLAAVEKHLAALCSLATRLERGNSGADASLVHNQVACEEYSAALQLRVLGIELSQLSEPILDVGCGKRGELVRCLRKAGLKAFGVDRLVSPVRYLAEADWLQYRFEPSSWGTIISHMAFSNHFRFHHLYRHGIPETYAAKLVEILNALKPGGELYYAPGLPFIEKLLSPPRYQVSTKAVATPGWARQELAQTGAQLAGEDRFYSTRITRLV
jgi:hypothetical protein